MVSEQQVKELLYHRFIEPTKARRPLYAGIELELPIVNLAGEPVDFLVVHDLTRRFKEQFGFAVDRLDDEGSIFSLVCAQTGDTLSYDCSYNNLEFSFGTVIDLHEVQRRFERYYAFVQEVLAQRQHTLTGMGINPHRAVNQKEPLPVGRYRMLYHHLQTAPQIMPPRYYHPYPDYGMFSSASQVQLDVEHDRLLPTLRAFSALEPLKALLFSNSPLSSNGVDYLCARDMLWEASPQGYNLRNVGFFDPVPASIDALVDYLAATSIYCTERGTRYLNFKPLPLVEFFATPRITAEYFENGAYHTTTIEPRLDDLTYLRTYKFEDITFRGTIEFRSVCCQPVRDTMSTAAFHIGLLQQVERINELLEADTVLYQRGHTAAKLRTLLVQRTLPDFIDAEKLVPLLLEVLHLAEHGLRQRGLGEESFLQPLFERAQKLEPPALRMLRQQESGTPLDQIIRQYAAL